MKKDKKTPVCPSPKNPGPFLCFVATSTEEKLLHLNTIARTNNIPIVFLSLNKITEAFRAAPEDTGNMVLNGVQKLGVIKDTIELFQTHKDFQNIIKQICTNYRMSFVPNNILFMGEDSTIVLPPDVWPFVRTDLSPYVPEEVLLSAEKEGPGPGAETGPIIAAVGMEMFANMIREGARKAGYRNKEVPIVDKVAGVFRRLGDSTLTPPTELNEAVTLYLATTNLSVPFSFPEDQINTTALFLSRDRASRTPNAGDFLNFLTTDSVRCALVKALYTKLTGQEVGQSQAPYIVTKKHNTSDFSVFDVKRPPLRLAGPEAPTEKRLLSALKPLKSFETADARVFYPLTGHNPLQRRQMILQLLITAVRKMTEASEKYKPLIVLDDGSWKPTTDLLANLANMGMWKDFVRLPGFEPKPLKTTSRADILSTCHIDFVLHPRLSELEKAAKELLQHRLRHYTPFNAPATIHTLCGQGGVDPIQNDRFTIGIMTTASNDNLVNTRAIEALAKHAARRGWGLSTGGGDRHGMGAAHNTYMREGGPHAVCTSTPPLIVSETEKGELPACHSWSIASDLLTRTIGIFAPCSAIVDTAGGAGTLVEAGGGLLLKELFPDITAGWNQIILNQDIHSPDGLGPNGFYDRFLRLMYGEAAADKLLDPKNDGVFGKGGVHVASSPEKAINLLQECAARGPKPLGQKSYTTLRT